jgi:hypothetical protein
MRACRTADAKADLGGVLEAVTYCKLDGLVCE